MAAEGKKSEVPEVDLSGYTIDPEVVKLIPASLAIKYKIFPLFKIGSNLTIAMADPKDIVAADEVRNILKMDVSVVKSSLRSIEEAISEYFGIASIVEEAIKKTTPLERGAKIKATTTVAPPIVGLVDAFISQAVRERASDIHVEPEAENVRIRFRVDGLLHEEFKMPSYMLNPVVSRIKILASMNIAESRVPQDGRFALKSEGKAVDFRVSTFPTAYGEKTVLRILDKSAMVLGLTDLGFSKENLGKFKGVIHKPHGIVLVTGPTGSGKTTTLYAALLDLNSKELNIVTVEDPIEYELPGITQSQVNIKAGLTFASALRSILRQDPDVIFVGEIRDLETATIAIQSALTGHLVFSTLHTNDAAGAIVRLLDMQVEPFLVSSSVEAVLAQRLVRLICKKCEEEVSVPLPIKKKYGIETMRKGKGCKACKGTGYKGRTCIIELFLLDEIMRKMITSKASSDEIKKYAVSQGMKTMFEDGLDKVKAGITSLDEVMRVTELD